MGKHGRCDRERLSYFVDNALTPEETVKIKEHLKNCRDCSAVVRAFETLSETIRNEVDRQISSVDTAPAGDKLFKIMGRKENSVLARIADFLRPGKIILQVASIAAIIAFSLIYYQERPAIQEGPSAIVTLVDGNAASVMILQTENENHTIIWYTET